MNDKSATAATKLALLIDGDNISASYMQRIMEEASQHGTIAVRRIYGQFKSGKMKSWEKHVEAFDLTRVNVSPLTRGKNATDMKLVIEAMDMLHGRQLDGVCIASSDGDFTPLAVRIRASALAVYGFGAKKAPAAYKAEFDRFYECDAPRAGTKPAAHKEAAPASPRKQATPVAAKPRRARAAPAPKSVSEAQPAKLAVPQEKVMAAITAALGADGRAHMRTVGNKLSSAMPGFTAKAYGYRTNTDLVRDLPGVELIKQGNETFVRRR